jgi:hypothetical protein
MSPSHHDQGDKVTHTEHNANTASTPKTGLFAALRGLLSSQGSSAISYNTSACRPIFLVALATALVALAFASVPALAAAEKPVVVSESVSEVEHPAEEARLTARVIPNGEAKCHFQYGSLLVEENEVSCEAEVINSFEERTVGVTLFGLVSGTTYQYRVILTNASGTTNGAPAQFTAAIPPETPELEGKETATGVKLKGTLNPNKKGSPATYEFLYKQSPTECTEGHATPPEQSTGELREQIETEPAGLLPNTIYTFCLRVHNGEEAAISTPIKLTTPAVAPTVGLESFTNVGSTSAELQAQVDPGGAPTTYFFQYGTTPAYGSTTPVASAGAGSEAVSVLAKLEGLEPNTPYYFRVVASNTHAANPIPGSQAKLTTFPTGIVGLPDDRGYELVSPLSIGNATVLPGAPEQAAADGSAVAYLGTAPPEGGDGVQGGGGEQRNHGTTPYLATRDAAGVWTAGAIQPNGYVGPGGASASYQGFSSDLSTGFLGSGRPLTSTGAADGEEGPKRIYSRDRGGSYSLLAENASYAGSTPDGSHVLAKSANGLYDSVGGQLEDVSLLPGGEPAPTPTLGPGTTFGSTTGDLEHVVSDDGSRIFWTTQEGVEIKSGPREGQTEELSKALYVRENDSQPDASTVLVAEGGEPKFQTASSDGSKVFFTDENKLTADSTAAKGAPDLYEYDLTSKAFTDLSVDSTGGHADVVGVLGASTDGSYVYYAAAGALAGSGAQPQECLNFLLPLEQSANTTKCNVYVAHEGTVRFVAAVTDVDGEGGLFARGDVRGRGDWVPDVGERTAHVTPDGRHLVFWSTEDLTGFEGGGSPEIYMYDFDSSLTCVSCNPTGALTHPAPYRYYVSTNLPESSNPTYSLRDLSTDGNRVFFESSEALVSQVANGEVAPPLETGLNTAGLSNVYEWERAGGSSSESGPEPNNSCTPKAPSFSTADGGCLYLLSGGTSNDASFFVDASENGEDAFIETRADLVPQDKGEVYELYDVRVGATEPPAEPECTGSGCQGVPGAPPIFATPSSVTFNGVGNFPPPAIRAKVAKKTVRCAKGKTRNKHNQCVKSKKQKAKAKKSAHINRRAK